MREKLFMILEDIYNHIYINNSSVSLMEGTPGILMFKLFYLKHIKENKLDQDDVYLIQELAEMAIAHRDDQTFCGGQAGLNWFFGLLFNQGLLEKDDLKIITTNNSLLPEIALKYLSIDYYDFLHGGIGIAFHLLNTKKRGLHPFFNDFLDGLNVLMTREESILPHFDFQTLKLDNDKINFGLSHGLASVLKFCMECYRNDMCKRKSKKIARRIADFYKQNINEDISHCYFPSIYGQGSSNRNSRLAWCYGDLGIAYILYQYGLLFNDEQINEISFKIFYHAANRRTLAETGVKDAGFCHGSAGVAYIFSKMWHKTNDPVFENAANHWFLKTIEFSRFNDGIAGYKKFSAADDSWKAEPGLIEGVAGIGLSILSHIFADYSWDYCVMLND